MSDAVIRHTFRVTNIMDTLTSEVVTRYPGISPVAGDIPISFPTRIPKDARAAVAAVLGVDPSVLESFKVYDPQLGRISRCAIERRSA